MKIGIVKLFITSFFVFTACTSSKMKQEVSDEIVLKIGNLEITKYEFEKNKRREYVPANKNYKSWVQEFIDKAYFIADAYNKRYDTISEIKKIINFNTMSFVADYKGPLWEKLEEPKLNFNNKDIKKAYEKRDKLFYIQYLKFPDRNIMLEFLQHDTLITTSERFKKYTSLVNFNSLVVYQDATYLYPFNELSFFKDEIYSIDKETIITPLYAAGNIYIIYIKAIEIINQQPFKKLKESILNDLKMTKTIQIIENKMNESLTKTNCTINYSAEDELFKELLQNRENRGISKILSDTLMTYTLNNVKTYFIISDFYDIYYKKVIIPNFNEKLGLHTYLREIVNSRYLYIEAEELGLTKEKKFILDKKNFTNNQIFYKYIENEIYRKTNISEKDIKSYYERNKENFIESEACIANLWIFNNENNAYLGWQHLKENQNNDKLQNNSDTSVLRGLVSFKTKCRIDNIQSKYPQDLIRAISGSRLFEISKPYQYKGQFVVFVKTKEIGKKIKLYNESGPEVKSILETQQAEELKKDRLTMLKKKYPVTINKLKPE